jgi:excisionase family DNA binding protein
MNKHDDILLRTDQVASRLQVAVRTVRLWAECGAVPAVKMGRQWRFRAADIQRIEANGDIDVKDISASRQLRQQGHTSGK